MFKFVHVWVFGFKGKLDGGRREAIWSAPEKKLGRGEGSKPDPGKKWPRKKISMGCLQPLGKVCYNRASIGT